jgi:hypothetical protein
MCCAEASDLFGADSDSGAPPQQAEEGCPPAADRASRATPGRYRPKRLWKSILRSGRLIYAPQTAMSEAQRLPGGDRAEGLGVGDAGHLSVSSDSESESDREGREH